MIWLCLLACMNLAKLNAAFSICVLSLISFFFPFMCMLKEEHLTDL